MIGIILLKTLKILRRNIMYRQFCKNYKNFIKLNKAGLEKNEYRLKIAESIKGLADLETYKKWKENNDIRYSEIENIVFEIKRRKDIFHFKSFSWELDGYGFEARKSDSADREKVEEQLKLIDILLGTSYWYDNVDA
jgi:hypothetical protein